MKNALLNEKIKEVVQLEFCCMSFYGFGAYSSNINVYVLRNNFLPSMDLLRQSRPLIFQQDKSLYQEYKLFTFLRIYIIKNQTFIDVLAILFFNQLITN
ncbi:hypothetical protein BpHYR1_048271 [Brachionus plicatilis]|uniref:Uncharacterized protein n=1 Tax=Brachionus plicatilis TaxID=10195 RepID=A0A3M7QIK3_BRAPC|nr:hypothetical protein BpHYR1_048271 [Brachionus plicatilis]